MRSVQANGELIPLTERPNGPTTSLTTARNPYRTSKEDPTTPTVATTTKARLAALLAHHLMANLIVAGGR
jgi:hypothetical protein